MTTNNQKPDQSPTRQGGSGTIAEDSRRSSEAGQKRGPQTGGQQPGTQQPGTQQQAPPVPQGAPGTGAGPGQGSGDDQ